MSSAKEHCPNHAGCKVIIDIDFPLEQQERTRYLHHYCQNGEAAWRQCKRYIVKSTWHVCPDFVLPDSRMSPDEIIERYEDELAKN